MINQRFLRIQLKRLWIPIVISGIVLGGYLGIAISGHFLAPFIDYTDNVGGKYYNNAFNLTIYFRAIFVGWLIFYSFIAVVRLLLVEQDRGYISSWLVSPMSRWTIFATKYLAMIIGLLIIDVWVLILQLIIYGALMNDFNQYVGYFFLSHLAALVGVFFISSLMWLIGSIFTRQWISVLIIAAFLAWCVVSSMLGIIGEGMGMEWMHNFRYASIFSLINTPFEYFEMPDKGVVGRILPIRALDYEWQIPLMAVLGVGCFIGSQFIFKNKNYQV